MIKKIFLRYGTLLWAFNIIKDHVELPDNECCNCYWLCSRGAQNFRNQAVKLFDCGHDNSILVQLRKLQSSQ